MEKPKVSFDVPQGAITLVMNPRPAFVSQKTSEAVLGIPAEQFLKMLRGDVFALPIVSVGKLRLVETEPLITFMRKYAGTIQL